MAISTENTFDNDEISLVISNYFSSIGIPQNYYENQSNEVNDLQKQLDKKRTSPEKNYNTLIDSIIAEQEDELEQKNSEVEMLKEQLTLMDVKIDKLDTLIENIDKEIVPLIDEINVAITSVKTAYDNRIAIGCSSDLYWQYLYTQTYTFPQPVGGFTEGIYTAYICKKNPSVEINYGYYGAKYYRKPQNQDYGANIVREFLGTIGIGKTTLAIVDSGGTTDIMLDDNIIDNINSPLVFSSTNLPKVVGFGTTAIVSISTYFGGSISSGSTIIAHTGIGTTTSISVGDYISLSGILTSNTRVVGFGTTTITYNNIWNPSSGSFISTSAVAKSLIINLPAVGTGTGTFSIGTLVTYPTLILNKTASADASSINFTVIRSTQSSSTSFDYSNNPIDPVTVGIISSNNIGVGHKLVKVSNGSPPGPFQWKEVMTSNFSDKTEDQLNESQKYLRSNYPEPSCGAGNAKYYSGNSSWPIKNSYTYGAGGYPPSSTSSSFASENDIMIVGTGITVPSNIGYSNVSQLNPSNSICVSYASSIVTAELNRDIIIQINSPKIDSLISASNSLRQIRDTMETRAFSILQGRVNANVEINKIKENLKSLRSFNFTKYEPEKYYFDETTGKLVSSKVGTGDT